MKTDYTDVSNLELGVASVNFRGQIGVFTVREKQVNLFIAKFGFQKGGRKHFLLQLWLTSAQSDDLRIEEILCPLRETRSAKSIFKEDLQTESNARVPGLGVPQPDSRGTQIYEMTPGQYLLQSDIPTPWLSEYNP